MSTKAIREALERVKYHDPHAGNVRNAEDALRELEAIEKAARKIVEARTPLPSASADALFRAIAEQER